MNFREIEKMISTFKARPIWTTLNFLVFLLIVAVLAYLSGFFEQKGKQHSMSPSKNIGTATVPKASGTEKTPNKERPIINQRTQGDQSPSVVSGGNVRIDYNTREDKNKKE